METDDQRPDTGRAAGLKAKGAQVAEAPVFSGAKFPFVLPMAEILEKLVKAVAEPSGAFANAIPVNEIEPLTYNGAACARITKPLPVSTMTAAQMRDAGFIFIEAGRVVRYVTLCASRMSDDCVRLRDERLCSPIKPYQETAEGERDLRPATMRKAPPASAKVASNETTEGSGVAFIAPPKLIVEPGPI